ncbi:MAG: GIY-YIG nuclease family protein, partial [Leptospiraceae bacterium]|nr:GIY-YIG nuclease family protein [Leptospiraceae bacterium]
KRSYGSNRSFNPLPSLPREETIYFYKSLTDAQNSFNPLPSLPREETLWAARFSWVDRRSFNPLPSLPREETIILKETKNYHLTERELHEKFMHKRIRGEWFQLNERDLKYIRSIN